MIKRDYPISPPWMIDIRGTNLSGKLQDEKVILLDKTLSVLFRSSIQMRSGTFTGTGKQMDLPIGISAEIVLIMRYLDKNRMTNPTAHHPVIACKTNEGVSYIFGTGYVNNAILSFKVDAITLGVNTACNEAGASFYFMALG